VSLLKVKISRQRVKQKYYKNNSCLRLPVARSGYWSFQDTLKRHDVINFRLDADPLANFVIVVVGQVGDQQLSISQIQGLQDFNLLDLMTPIKVYFIYHDLL
jgi:hypothetical protein